MTPPKPSGQESTVEMLGGSILLFSSRSCCPSTPNPRPKSVQKLNLSSCYLYPLICHPKPLHLFCLRSLLFLRHHPPSPQIFQFLILRSQLRGHHLRHSRFLILVLFPPVHSQHSFLSSRGRTPAPPAASSRVLGLHLTLSHLPLFSS